jgi:hypothetical protein
VSYRRDDAAGHAGRLYDALAERFGPTNVFMDIDTIDLGVEFRAAIDGAIASCDVVLGVIGRGWATATDASGRRRLDDPDDFVRLELESAFARNIAVIPTLVQGADMPSSGEVPPSLSPLPGRQGIELRDTAWHADVDRLVRRLERRVHDNLAGGDQLQQPGDHRRPRPAPERVPRSYGRRARRVLLPMLLALVALAAAAAAMVVLRSGDDAAKRRLASVVPRGLSCEESDEPVAGAVTLACAAGSGLGVAYAQFQTLDDLDDWYAAKVPADLAPGSGSCDDRPFRGEKPYVVGGKRVGRFVCFFDNQGEAQLVWKDERWTVGGEAAVHESEGTPGAGPGEEGARLLFGAWNRRMQLRG